MGGMGVAEQSAEADMRRAAERVTLACRALSAAAKDLHVAYARTGASGVVDASDQVRAETERVCELAGELAKLGAGLASAPLARRLTAVKGAAGPHLPTRRR